MCARNFYRTVLRTLVDLGFVSLQQRFAPERKDCWLRVCACQAAHIEKASAWRQELLESRLGTGEKMERGVQPVTHEKPVQEETDKKVGDRV